MLASPGAELRFRARRAGPPRHDPRPDVYAGPQDVFAAAGGCGEPRASCRIQCSAERPFYDPACRPHRTPL